MPDAFEALQDRWGVGVQAVGKRGAVKGETRWLYRPTAKQIQFHACRALYALYGGAAGGGKSHALRWDAYRRCLYKAGYRALLLRRTFRELEDTHIESAKREVVDLGATYLVGEHKLRFANGAVVQFGHCEKSGDEMRYLSTEYDWIGFDEIVTFLERQYQLISSRARTANRTVTPLVRAATNPGGVGAAWVRAQWITHDVDLAAYPSYRAEDYAYIPATLDDNPHINPQYELALLNLPEALRRAYRYGDWDVFEGQYFTEWRKDRHVLREQPVYPAWVERVRALDWGYLRPGVCKWYACLPDGRVVVEQEYVFKETLAKDVAAEILRRTALIATDEGTPVRVRYSVADPAMWIRDGQSGESIAETFARAGVPLTRANHDRVNGWQRLRAWFALAADGRPYLQYGPGCGYSARTIPMLVYDLHKMSQGEPDVNTDGEDHAADCDRYFVMSRPSPSARPSQPPVVQGTAGALLAAVRRVGARALLGADQVRHA